MGIKEKVLEDDNELQRYIILLANANDESIKGRTKLQKMMFLLSDRIDEIKEQSSYAADDYGPYSKVVDKESQYLEQIGVILSSDSEEITITEIGKEIAKEFLKKSNKNTLGAIEEYKRFLNDLSSDDLLAYVYSAYPDMAKKSAKYNELKPHIEDHLLSLIERQKISAQRAAELLNKSQDYIIKKMNKKGIVVLG